MLAAVALAGIGISGCTYLSTEASKPFEKAGLPTPPALERTPPPVTLRHGGPSGEVLAGSAPSPVPEDNVDDIVGVTLRPWLTALERRQLAEASERAATGTTGTPVPWQAVDGKGARTAAGAAMATDAIFRSIAGKLCRDVRQSIEKGDEAHQQAVVLCRQPLSNDVVMWLIGSPDR
jgi:hypothetical protein